MKKIVISLTIVAVVAILSMMVCPLAALGYNSRISMEKKRLKSTPYQTSIKNNPEQRVYLFAFLL